MVWTFLLHVVGTASVADKHTQKKTLTVRRRGFNSYDDTGCCSHFEVIYVTFREFLNAAHYCRNLNRHVS
ncbi:hypothetical protein DWS23_00430 [Escherichia coli]|nr:hypothetical protein C1192_09660 [Escherichia marmotae]EFN9755769.1 hypothetical protein [Escherichia coli]PSS40362.1 hypothetical protein BEM40_012070 [Escherichia sp. MOD1-EC5451]PSY67885.1 hypothetical protein C7B16_03160 [Escherichia sp. 20412-1]EFO1359749.1 hypothetical protein [Escherichia coli]